MSVYFYTQNERSIRSVSYTHLDVYKRQTQGNLNSIADADYVNYAHQSNLEVWTVLRDFHGGINSADETYEVLSHTSRRTNLIDQRSEEHTSELQSHSEISYAVFCLNGCTR